MAAEKYCDRIYNCRKSDVRNSNDDNTNNNEAKDRNNDGTDRDRERCRDSGGVYLFMLDIMIDFITKSSSFSSSFSSSSSSIADGSVEKNSYNDMNAKNENKNGNKSGNNEVTKNSDTKIFIDFSDVIKLAEKCHQKINTQSFLSLVPPTLPLYMIEKYLRIVIENENHKKRNLMVKLIFVFLSFHSLLFILPSKIVYILAFSLLLSLSLFFFSLSLLLPFFLSFFFFNPFLSLSLTLSLSLSAYLSLTLTHSLPLSYFHSLLFSLRFFFSQVLHQLLRVREVNLRTTT